MSPAHSISTVRGAAGGDRLRERNRHQRAGGPDGGRRLGIDVDAVHGHLVERLSRGDRGRHPAPGAHRVEPVLVEADDELLDRRVARVPDGHHFPSGEPPGELVQPHVDLVVGAELPVLRPRPAGAVPGAGLEAGLEAPGNRDGTADGAGRLLLGSERKGNEQQQCSNSHFGVRSCRWSAAPFAPYRALRALL